MAPEFIKLSPRENIVPKIKRPLLPRITRQVRLAIWPTFRDIRAIEIERLEDYKASYESQAERDTK